MTDHNPKCLAYGFGPGQRMDICICTGIRIGRADERSRTPTDHDPLCPIADYKCLCDRIAITRAGARAEYARLEELRDKAAAAIRANDRAIAQTEADDE